MLCVSVNSMFAICFNKCTGSLQMFTDCLPSVSGPQHFYSLVLTCVLDCVSVNRFPTCVKANSMFTVCVYVSMLTEFQ